MKNDLKNNVLIKEDGYTLKHKNSTVKHYTKKMFGSKDGYEFVSYTSTTHINYNDDFELNFDSNRWNDFDLDMDINNHLMELPINKKEQISYNSKKNKNR